VGLSRAVQGGVVPIDVLLTAGQLGLTALQTELIAYLILGLSNMEIADAMNISEATVRWRLTRLYRVLDVRGRKAAAERARELGLDALVTAAPTPESKRRSRSAPK
jgi:DNA-binding CsgD family transcriptional regulator